MAFRPTSPPKPERPVHSVEQKRRCIQRIERCVNDLKAFDPSTIQKRFGAPEVIVLQASIDEALSAAFGHGTTAYDRYCSAAKLDQGLRVIDTSLKGRRSIDYDARDAGDARRYLAEGKDRSIVLLAQAIRALEDEIADQEHSQQTLADAPKARSLPTRKVFVVHGHDEGAREAVARFLERIEFQPIILHEQANKGRTIIEKVEEHGDVDFAVVLLTPDDEGCEKGGTPAPRARQNVMLELGYFIGRLGRDHVCALKRTADLEIPSDFGGVVYETFDASGGWKQALGRELQEAGFDIDWNKVMR